jgi:hypothetical protein
MESKYFQKKSKRKKHSLLNGQIESTKKENLLNRYNNLNSKGNINNSFVKTMVDILAGAMVAPALSASLGKYAPLAGIALSFGGNYTGDESGLMRGVGMATIAHSIAKSNEYRQEDSTLQSRISGLKDDWLRTVMLKKSDQNNTPEEIVQAVKIPETESTKETLAFVVSPKSEEDDPISEEKSRLKKEDLTSNDSMFWEDDTIDFSKF